MSTLLLFVDPSRSDANQCNIPTVTITRVFRVRDSLFSFARLHLLSAIMSNITSPEAEQSTIQRDKTAMAEHRLYSDELYWRDRYHFFKDRGYLLRPRYHPDWVASWKGTNKNWLECEDGLVGEVKYRFLKTIFVRVLTIQFVARRGCNVCDAHERRGPSYPEETYFCFFDK